MDVLAISVIVAIGIFFDGADIFERAASLSENWLEKAQKIVNFVIHLMSTIALDNVSFVIHFVFFKACLLIHSMFQQLENDVKELNNAKVGKDSEEKVKKIVEFHNEILRFILILIDLFAAIIGVNIFMNVMMISQSLVIAKTEFINIPSVLFDILDSWCYCFAMQIVVTKVILLNHKLLNNFDRIFQSEQMANFVYLNIDWHDFKSIRSKKALALIMMKFQQPIKTKVFIILNVNLELFASVSWEIRNNN